VNGEAIAAPFAASGLTVSFQPDLVAPTLQAVGLASLNAPIARDPSGAGITTAIGGQTLGYLSTSLLVKVPDAGPKTPQDTLPEPSKPALPAERPEPLNGESDKN
jgi:hypothetical protein